MMKMFQVTKILCDNDGHVYGVAVKKGENIHNIWAPKVISAAGKIFIFIYGGLRT